MSPLSRISRASKSSLGKMQWRVNISGFMSVSCECGNVDVGRR
jgi:hypothetical protein